ncbi:MAG TPA: ferritin-like domain-containing protein [Burkholderiales bacterium]|nr:ferritin-like domain-containing protein [Burkholderiales bacterium]
MSLRIGSQEHRDLFCRFFVDSHIRFDPRLIAWPKLDGDALTRVTGLPFWQEAVSTEHVTARIVQAAAEAEPDPVVREALALQGHEEGRHSQLLHELTRFYGIDLPAFAPPSAKQIHDRYLYAGYGECFDSFFAFGLIALARRSGYFSAELVDIFEPIMQEEARHILFFVNWVAYRRAHQSWPRRSLFDAQRLMVTVSQILSRVKTARGMNEGENFTMKGHEGMNADVTPRRFLEICLAENDQRFNRYDPRLIRPHFVPSVARLALRFLRK